MKTAEIKKLKDMSNDAMQCLPVNITINGKNNLFCKGQFIELITFLRNIENVEDKMWKLNGMIQSIKSDPVDGSTSDK